MRTIQICILINMSFLSCTVIGTRKTDWFPAKVLTISEGYANINTDITEPQLTEHRIVQGTKFEVMFENHTMKALLGKRDEGRTYVEKAIDIDPEHAPNWIVLGDILVQSRDIQGAVSAYREAVTLEKDNVAAWLKYADSLFQNNEKNHAIRVLRRSIAVNPDSHHLYYSYCSLLLQSGEKKKGYEILEKGLLLNYELHTILFDYYPQARRDRIIGSLIEKYKS